MHETRARTPSNRPSDTVIDDRPIPREPQDTVVFEAAAQPLAPAKDRVRWGPVWAGFVTAFTTLFLLGLLGAAIGLTAYNPSGVRRWMGDSPTPYRQLSLSLDVAGTPAAHR